MKIPITILALICLTQLSAQNIDKDYVIKWIKAADSTFDVEAVVKYSIDRESYYTTDTAKLNSRLQLISTNRIKGIFFSKYKTDNYVPGKGTIYILTVQKQTPDDAKEWLEEAKKLFVDEYASFSQHIFTNAKDPVLIIDNRSVHHTEIKLAFEALDTKYIYDIYLSPSAVPFSIYGQNAKNGLVQIWTTRIFKD